MLKKEQNDRADIYRIHQELNRVPIEPIPNPKPVIRSKNIQEGNFIKRLQKKRV
jgi:hypothetical protein